MVDDRYMKSSATDDLFSFIIYLSRYRWTEYIFVIDNLFDIRYDRVIVYEIKKGKNWRKFSGDIPDRVRKFDNPANG